MPDVFHHTAATDGHDVVVDFQAGSDVLVLFGTAYGSFAAATASSYFDAANLVFNTGHGSSVTVLNTTASALTAETLLSARAPGLRAAGKACQVIHRHHQRG